VCVYVGQECKVNLWGASEKAERSQEYSQNSITMTASSIKSVTALVAALMVDRGLFNYDDLVYEHWPKFGRHGKALTRVKDVLKMEAGIPTLDARWSINDTLTENIKKNAIGKYIEEQRQEFPIGQGSIRAYHPFTRGKKTLHSN